VSVFVIIVVNGVSFERELDCIVIMIRFLAGKRLRIICIIHGANSQWRRHPHSSILVDQSENNNVDLLNSRQPSSL
jgi:hypothetical protein